MGYRSSGYIVAALLCSIINAQASEAILWRIESEVEQTELVPAYDEGPTPFPVVIAPEPEEDETTFEPSQEDVQRQREEERRNLLASEVLAEIRNLLENDAVFNPDITTSRVEAVIFGENGTLALINDEWLGVGDALSVPTRAKDRLNNLVRTLKSLEPALAHMVEEEVNFKAEESKEFQLTIKEIGDGYINLMDERQKRHVINFSVNPS